MSATAPTVTEQKSTEVKEPHPTSRIVDGKEMPAEKATPCKKKKTNRKGNVENLKPWMSHVKQFRVAHPGMSYKECLKEAKNTYKK